MLVLTSPILNVFIALHHFAECISNFCVCVPVAAEPRDGEGLSNSDSLCL